MPDRPERERSDEPEIRIVKVPVPDTGIGREMGYADDAEFIAAAEAEREALLADLTPEARKCLEQVERDADRRFLFGEVDHEAESTDLYLTWRERLWRWRASRRERRRKSEAEGSN